MVKAVAANALYSTNVYAIVPVAEHLTAVLGRRDLSAAGPELVEELANVPAGGSEKRPRRRHSFASKFAHFFIAPDRFPILDRFAEETVRRHLGNAPVRDPERPYVAFVAYFARLRATIKPTPTIAALDHYLLIAGQARAFRDGRAKEAGSELRDLFRVYPGELDLTCISLLREDHRVRQIHASAAATMAGSVGGTLCRRSARSPKHLQACAAASPAPVPTVSTNRTVGPRSWSRSCAPWAWDIEDVEEMAREHLSLDESSRQDHRPVRAAYQTSAKAHGPNSHRYQETTNCTP